MNTASTLTLPALTAAEALQRLTLRRLMRQRRAGLTAAQQMRAATALCHRALSCLALQNAHHIALYCPFDGEIDPHPLCRQLWQQGKQLYLPRLDLERPRRLLFLPYTNDTPLQRNRFGILEPRLPLKQACPLAQLAVIFLPIVAFDADCHRLGMGGGYYDRTLNTHLRTEQRQQPLLMIGLAHDCQQVASLPRALWDRRLHAIITPNSLFSIAEP